MKAQIEHLQQKLKHATHTNEKIDHLNQLAWLLKNSDLEQCKVLAEEALRLAQQAGYSSGIAYSLSNLAIYSFYQSKYDQALTQILEANQLFEALDERGGLSQTYNTTGITYTRLGNPSEGLDFHFQALKLAEQVDDPESIARAYTGIAIVYVYEGSHDKAIVYFQNALKICQQSHDKRGEANALLNLCMTYKDLGQHKLALACGRQSLTLCRTLNDRGREIGALNNIGATYAALGKYDAALSHYEQALALLAQTNDSFDHVYTRLNLSRLYLSHDKLQEAKKNLQVALSLAESSRQQGFQFECHELLAQIFKREGNFEQALAHHEQFHAIKSQIFDDEASTKLRHLEVVHRTELARQEAALYELKYVQLAKEISARKQAEKALIQTQKLESLGSLAGGIAHDFNNLLVAVMGQISLAMRKQEVGKSGYKNLKKALKATKRAAELTAKMLAYSGKSLFNLELLNLNDVIIQNLPLLHSNVGRNIELDANLLKPLPQIYADVGQLQQILINLVLNASEAIGDEIGAIEISTSITALTRQDEHYWRYTTTPLPPDDYLILKVLDTGQGMSTDTLDKLFDPFYTTKFMGRGLGLAAVLGIVRGHKGGICVRSKAGGGSTFEIALPIINVNMQRYFFVPKPSTPLANRGTVLVIDDEVEVRETAKDILTSLDLQVILAPNGRQGIEAYQQHWRTIDAVLLDLTMPGLSGAQTWHEISQINPTARVILSSGYDQNEVIRQLKQPIDFLAKPFDADKFIDTFQRYFPQLIS